MGTGQGLLCEGDCKDDEDCSGDLECYHRGQTGVTNLPPGCYGSFDSDYTDFCYDPNCHAYVIDYVDLTPGRELHHCQIDCDNDDQCADDLECFQRNGDDAEFPPGCYDPNDESEYDWDEGYDMCYDPDYEADTSHTHYLIVDGGADANPNPICQHVNTTNSSIGYSCCTVDGSSCARPTTGAMACEAGLDFYAA